MTFLANYISYIQIALSVALISIIMIQHSDAGMGGSSIGQPFRTKRGLEKAIFIMTIIVAVLFAISALGALYLSSI